MALRGNAGKAQQAQAKRGWGGAKPATRLLAHPSGDRKRSATLAALGLAAKRGRKETTATLRGMSSSTTALIGERDTPRKVVVDRGAG